MQCFLPWLVLQVTVPSVYVWTNIMNVERCLKFPVTTTTQAAAANLREQLAKVIVKILNGDMECSLISKSNILFYLEL